MATKDGKKTGGRKKGTPNKRTQMLEEILESMNCAPLENLARIANGERIRCTTYLNKETGEQVEEDVIPTLDQQITANKELLQYLYPKKRATEVTGKDGGPIDLRGINVTFGKK